MEDLYVTCGQGLEELLIEELQELGFQKLQKGYCGVYVGNADLRAIYRINYGSRIAIRVLLPLRKFKCYNADSLYNEVSAIDWIPYLPQGKTFAIDSVVSHKNLRNSLFAAQVAKDAICDQLKKIRGSRPNIDVQNPDVQLNLYIHDTQGIMSFDTSGVPLYKRGYRIESVEAPMQESLAAALLRIAGYKGEETVCDPCCGSGTLLIEAALIKSKTPPGYLRQKWGFMFLPGFSQIEWLKVKMELDSNKQPLQGVYFCGCDISKNALRITKTNLRAAGFYQNVDLVQSDFKEYAPPMPCHLVITNPPHGKRLQAEEDLVSLYRALGDFMKHKTSLPGRGFVFTSNLELAKEIGLAPKRRHVVMASGEECRFLEFDIR